MKSANKKILVKVNMEQKDFMEIGGVTVKCAYEFDVNYRRRSPVVGQFAESNEYFKCGELAIFHHNHFYPPSPYFLQDDLFSVPLTKAIFGVLDSYGELNPVMGNLTVKTIPIPTPLPVPPEEQKHYINRYEIVNPGWTAFKKGDIVFTRPNAGYPICFTWNGEERVIYKIPDDQICGILKNI